jgi:AcrR family transcriptional regulator
MTGRQRREQLLDIGRHLFAERGFDGTTIVEIAARAAVAKPVVYEHFGSKDGLYGVIVDREVQHLLNMTQSALTEGNPHELLERTALAFLDYIEESSDGFRILVRDSPVATSSGGFASFIGDIARRVEHILAREFTARGYDPKLAPMYAQMLVGMVAFTGQWWLEARTPKREKVAAHMVNLAWNGLSALETNPPAIRRSASTPRQEGL